MQVQDTNLRKGLEAIRWPFRTAKAIVKLPTHIHTLYDTRTELQNKAADAARALEALEAKIDALHDDITTLATHFGAFDKRLTNLESRQKAFPQASVGNTKQEANVGDRFADNHDLDDFYVGFEDKFRGSEGDIKKKVEIYPPRFKKTGVDFNKYPIIDLGCGRGELLQAFRSAKLSAIGLDINFEMVERAKANGMEAVQGDAITYLQSLEPASVGGITGMHLIEHIPFPELVTLFKECYRVLQPDGIVVFETPNPENLMVGIYSFYMDPSHLHPLPPPLTGFALESAGFINVETLRLHDADTSRPTYEDRLLSDLSYRVYGPLDYAAMATKPGAINLKYTSKKKR